MNIAEKRAALRAHPDTVLLAIAGEERPWNLGRWGLRLAKQAGIDVDAMFKAFESSGAGAIGAVGDLLVCGLLPFDDDAADVVDLLSVGDFEALGEQLTAVLGGLSDDEGEPGKPEATAGA